jgi:hypothetical protein
MHSIEARQKIGLMGLEAMVVRSDGSLVRGVVVQEGGDFFVVEFQVDNKMKRKKIYLTDHFQIVRKSKSIYSYLKHGIFLFLCLFFVFSFVSAVYQNLEHGCPYTSNGFFYDSDSFNCNNLFQVINNSNILFLFWNLFSVFILKGFVVHRKHRLEQLFKYIRAKCCERYVNFEYFLCLFVFFFVSFTSILFSSFFLSFFFLRSLIKCKILKNNCNFIIYILTCS